MDAPRTQRFWSLRIELLEQQRVLQNLSLEDLAQKATTDRDTVSDVLRGRVAPRLKTAHRLLRALAISPSEGIAFDLGSEFHPSSFGPPGAPADRQAG